MGHKMVKHMIDLNFNFDKMLTLDLQDFHTVDKEVNFIIDTHNKIISIRKGKEASEAKASLARGNFKTDFLEIFIWDKKDFPDQRTIEFDYANARKTAQKVFLIVIENGEIKEFKQSDNKCILQCEQDQDAKDIRILLKEAVKGHSGNLEFTSENVISHDGKAVDITKALF